jgi:nitric oxide reductase subunit B
MAIYAHLAMRRSGLAHPNKMAIHWTIGSAIFSAVGHPRSWRTWPA